MSKLSVQLIQDQLLREDEVKKATYDKMKVSNASKPKEVGTPKDPSQKVTKIKQVEVPTGDTGKKQSKSSSSAKETFPAAKDATDEFGRQVPDMSKEKNAKSPSAPSVKQGPKPNQSTKLKDKSSGAVKNTDGGNTYKTALPQAKSATDYIYGQGHGNQNLGGKTGSTPEVGNPSVQKQSSTTRPKGKEVSTKIKDKDSKTVSQVEGPSKKMPQPSDAPSKPSWDKAKDSGHNVMEGVRVSLGGKPKAHFGIVNKKILNRMAESYKRHGYELEITRESAPWKKDRKLRELVRESLDAKYNHVPGYSKKYRKEAFQHFKSLCQNDYHDLYENRREFSSTLKEAFDRLMEKAEQNYLNKLEIFECMARVEVDQTDIDLEIVTEATSHDMALRQVNNAIVEEYGFQTPIRHIFVDGTKYRTNQIKDWEPNLTE